MLKEMVLNSFNFLKKKGFFLLKYDIVSFDIYDTAVKRMVNAPEDVFKLMEIILNDEFKEKRVAAEKKARQNTISEITIDDIYKEISANQKYEIENLKRLEIYLEKRICYPNRKIYDIYSFTKKNKKKIIFTSDMYLSGEVLNEVLHRCGYSKFDGLFVSSEIKKKKTDGKIFDYLRDKYKGQRIIHIGDKFKSDCIMAVSRGVDFLYCGNTHKNKKGNSVLEDYIMNFAEYHMKENGNRDFQFGYKRFGPLLYGFCQWLMDEIKKEGVDNIIFFSREGKLIKEAFELIHGNKANLHYMFVSRRSLRVPSLYYCNSAEDVMLLFPVERQKISQYVKGLGVSINQVYGLKKFIDDNSDCNVTKEIIRDLWKKYKQDIKSYAKTELDNLKIYLDQVGVKGKKNAIVDIGWTGSMQFSLEMICKKEGYNTEFVSYFLGQRPEMKKFSKFCLQSKGYLCNYNDSSEYIDLIVSNCAILELLFIADHGTTINYYLSSNNIVVPQLGEFEGEATYRAIRKIQIGALKFCEDFTNCGIKYIKIDKKTAFSGMADFFKYPSMQDIKLFGDLQISDGDIYRIAPRSSVIRIKKFYRDFMNSQWKVGFLKRNLYFSFPYYKIYLYIREKSRKNKEKNDAYNNI